MHARRKARPSLRRSTWWLIAAVVTLGVAVLLGLIGAAVDDDESEAGPTPNGTRADATLEDTPEPPAMHTPSLLLPLLPAGEGEPATVLDIIDGDTIDVRLLGGQEERVRYYGIDTPERGDECFSESSSRNSVLAGDAVLLLPDARNRDSSGRLLRYVFREDGSSIDAQLINEGLALAWREDGAFRDALVALESDAQQRRAGCLWEGP
jgi:micrococcal nuclease